MARGDKVTVRYLAGEKLNTDTFAVTSAGGQVTVEWPTKSNPNVVIKLLGRTGKVRRSISLRPDALLTLEEERRDDE